MGCPIGQNNGNNSVRLA